jgi:hypothetical protein
MFSSFGSDAQRNKKKNDELNFGQSKKSKKYGYQLVIISVGFCFVFSNGLKAARVIEKSKFLKSFTFVLVVKPLQLSTKIFR